jgi:CHAT domain-containing protein
MSCKFGFFRPRHGWQRPSTVDRCVRWAAVALLLACGACGPGPRDTYRSIESLRRSDRIEEAVSLAGRTLSAWHGSPEWLHSFRIQNAELLILQGRPEQALALLDSPVPTPVPATPELQAGYCYVRGYALSQLGRGSEARALLEKARDIAAGAHLSSLESTVLVRLGTVLFFLGDRSQAEQCYAHALAQADAARDPYLQARSQEALGFLYLNNSRYDECASWSSRALQTYQALGAEIRTASVSDNLGWCDYRLGNHDDAQVLFAGARRLFTKHSQWQALGINLNANGAAANARGDWRAGRADYEQVIELATKTGDMQTLADGRTNLATTLILMGDIAAAETANDAARSIPEDRVAHETHLRMQLNAGRIAAARGKLADAETISRLVADSGIRQPRLIIDAQAFLAKVLELEGRPRDAEKELQRALAHLDDSRAELLRDESKLTYSAGLIEPFRQYVELLCRQGRTLDALEIAESSRARLLSERSSVAKASIQLAALRDLAHKTGKVLLFYWVSPGQSRVWAVTSAGIVHAALPADAQIQSLVDTYRRFIEGYGDPLAAENPGRELFSALIGPVQHLIPAGSHVVIVPDGPLFDINFESLPVPGDRPHYWLEDVTLSVTPSLSLLLRPESTDRPQGPRLLLIGDPLTSGQKDLPALANVRTEMERIRLQFPPGASVLRAGAGATPNAYAEAGPANFSIIHFAAHATANRDSPLDSAVVLTPRRGDYKLYAREIRNCPIRADLVTISACRSAGARTYAGEGLVGFAWAFLGAGARNVVAGLWEVDDRSTAQLMESMYRELQRGARPAEALRQAKLALAGSSGSFRKPFYWAPFQLFTVSLN